MTLNLFHGSGEFTGTLDPKYTKSGYGVWFTTNRDVAERYIRSGGFLYIAEVTLKNPFECSFTDFLKDHQPKGREWREELLNNKFDGVIINNNGSLYYIPLHACQIRVLEKI